VYAFLFLLCHFIYPLFFDRREGLHFLASRVGPTPEHPVMYADLLPPPSPSTGPCIKRAHFNDAEQSRLSTVATGQVAEQSRLSTRDQLLGGHRVHTIITSDGAFDRASHPGTVLAIDDWEYSGWCCIFVCVKT